MPRKTIDEATYQAMLAKARRTDSERTVSEHERGLGSPADGGFIMLLRTMKDALECAIKMRDWQTACEAMVFLQQALAMIDMRSERIGVKPDHH